MATVVLSVIGTVVAGPIGGAIGAIAGSALDNSVLAPSGSRKGPRLKELDVQTSSYGSTIPAIFGSMRVAGSVIWATDLQERKKKKKGGKGKPSTTTYSYSVSLAVALSSRPLQDIGRIWADGKLLRGAAGDFKTQTEFRFYNGNGGQPVDPLIASDVGAGNCSAHRGLAYVVFEDLQLAEYGNRIPQLTFEVIERSGAVPLGDIFADLSNGVIAGDVAESVHGYAAEGASARDALSPLRDNCPVSIFPAEDRLQLSQWPVSADVMSVPIAAGANGRSLKREKHSRGRADDLPKSLQIRHYEPARDYQLGVQESQRAGPGFGELSVDLPAALDAASAKKFADMKLLNMQHGQSLYEANLLFGDTALHPGDWIGDQEPVRISEVEHHRGYSLVSARGALRHYSGAGGPVSSGEHAAALDLQVGETRLVAMDLPLLSDSNPSAPLIAIAAAGTQPGWRAANLALRQGSNLIDLGSTARAASMGALTEPMKQSSGNIFDLDSSITVQLLHDQMSVPPVQDDLLDPAASAVWVGGEIIRYGDAADLGGGIWRLTRLLRGSAATESAIAPHPAGSDVVFLEEDALRIVNGVYISRGSNPTFEAIGIGDETPVTKSILANGIALKPRRPVHGSMRLENGGDRHFSWQRRPRRDLGWLDNVDQPLTEENERYIFELFDGAQSISQAELSTPEHAYTSQQWNDFSFGQGSVVSARIRQIGTYDVSPTLTMDIENP